MPDPTDLVKDLPADFAIFGNAVDSTVKTNADAAIAKTIVDAKGDIIAATAADTVSRLAVGSNDQVLTADSSTATGLKWATAASGGMTLLSTTSLSGASVTISSIPQTYKSLYLLIYGVSNATATGDFRLRFNASTGFDYHLNGAGTGVVMNVQGEEYLELNGNQTNPLRTSTNNCFALFVQNYTNASNWKSFQGHALFENSGGKTCIYGGGWSDNSAVTSIVLLNSGGNFSTGTALLYGVN
jgi:hypothetical protein